MGNVSLKVLDVFVQKRVRTLFLIFCVKSFGDCNLLQHLHCRACLRGGGGRQLGEVIRLSIQSLILI